jgi:hypothetical protein
MRVTMAGGVLVNGGYDVGDRNAELRRSGTGTPPPLTLFRAESAVERVVGADLRVAFAFTPALAVEAGATWSKPELAITISADDEVSGGVTIREPVSQYTVDVSALYHVPGLRFGRRSRAYATAGGGYLRQVYEGNLVIETGATYHAGAGVLYWLHGGGPSERAFGLRGEARYVRRARGIEFEDRSRSYPSLRVLAFAGF